MKSTIKRLPKSIVEITIEDSASNIAKYRKKVINNIREHWDIKGFRKWTNIPEDIIVQNYWEEKIMTMIIDEALDISYKKALSTHNLIPMDQADLKEIISESPMVVKLEVEVLPEVEIDPKYKEIKIKKTIVKVDDSEVDNAINEIKHKFTKYEKIEDPTYKIKKGDITVVDTEWFDESGNFLEETGISGYPLLIWSGAFVPGFEDNMIWANPWAKLEFDIIFPSDYHNDDYKNKKIKFKVKINEIKQTIEPEFTEEFIENLRGKKTDFEWLKEIIRWEILETKEMNSRIDDENKLLDELIKISNLDIGDAIMDRQINIIFEEVKANISESGGKMHDYLNSLNMSEEEYKEKNLKYIAERRIKWEFIFSKLNKLESHEVSSEEINEEIKKIMSRFNSEDVKKKLIDLYKEWTKQYEELKQRISYSKLIDSFFIL